MQLQSQCRPHCTECYTNTGQRQTLSRILQLKATYPAQKVNFCVNTNYYWSQQWTHKLRSPQTISPLQEHGLIFSLWCSAPCWDQCKWGNLQLFPPVSSPLAPSEEINTQRIANTCTVCRESVKYQMLLHNACVTRKSEIGFFWIRPISAFFI